MLEVRCRIGSDRGEVAMATMPQPTLSTCQHSTNEFLPKQGTKWRRKCCMFECQIILFSTAVLIEDIIFTSPCGDRTAILHSHLTHTNILQFAGQRKFLHFFGVFFKIWSIYLALGIEPTISHFAVKCSTDCYHHFFWQNLAFSWVFWTFWQTTAEVYQGQRSVTDVCYVELSFH